MKTLRELRLAAGLSQEGLARKLDVSLSIVQRWESGARPNGSSRRRAAALFGLTEEAILWPAAEPKEKTA